MWYPRPNWGNRVLLFIRIRNLMKDNVVQWLESLTYDTSFFKQNGENVLEFLSAFVFVENVILENILHIRPYQFNITQNATAHANFMENKNFKCSPPINVLLSMQGVFTHAHCLTFSFSFPTASTSSHRSIPRLPTPHRSGVHFENNNPPSPTLVASLPAKNVLCADQ